MDSSYNTPVTREAPPFPSNASSSNYQVNVNRQKTRKWVQAKAQNYDGDDWGAEEDEDEDDEEDDQSPQPLPQVPSRQQSMPERRPIGGQGAAPELQAPSKVPPSLHIQTQAGVQPQSQNPPEMVAPSQTAGDAGADLVSDPSSLASPSEQRASGQPVSPVSMRSPPPFSADGTERKPPPFVRPSDIYRKMEEERRRSQETERSSLDEAARRSTDNAPSGHDVLGQHPPQQRSGLARVVSASEDVPAPANVEEPATQDIGPESPAAIDRKRLSTSPQLPDVARMSAFGLDLFSSGAGSSGLQGPDAVPASAAAPLHKVDEPTEEDVRPVQPHNSSALDGAENKTDAAGPSSEAIPSNAREVEERQVSTEDASTTQTNTSTVAQPNRPTESAPPPTALVTNFSPPAGAAPILGHQESNDPADGPEVSPISEHDEEAVKALDGHGGAKPVLEASPTKATLLPANDPNMVAPLRTPSPRERGHLPPPTVVDASAPTDTTDVAPTTAPSTAAEVTPTEPLQPGRAHQLPPDLVPQPVGRTGTFDTVTSSPLKESDVLSDEIMRTLSPVSSPRTETDERADNRKSLAGAIGGPTRESTYSLSDYDSYWAASNEPKKTEGGQAVPPVPTEVNTSAQAVNQPRSPVQAEPAAPVPPPTVTAVQTNVATPRSPPIETSSTGRRRFSWEMGAEDTPPAPAAASSEPQPQPVPQSDLIAPAIVSQPPEPESSESASVPRSVIDTQEQPQQSPLPEPPSPISTPDITNRDSVAARENVPHTLADEKAALRSQDQSAATMPPSDAHPALSGVSSAQPPGSFAASNRMSQSKVPPFREIMNMRTPSERIAAYNSTRQHFAEVDLGLENWLVNLQAEHPEHLSGAPAGGIRPQNLPGQSSSPVGQAPPAQQPYYQQYLNASTPASQSPSTGRARIPGFQGPSSHGSSGFGHSSNQIGTKSKELMQSAGKMGKGLFSKGKSKLRGNGDKDDDSPPQSPQKPKNNRRSSWGLSLGPKTRTNETPQHSSQNSTTSASLQPPQLPPTAPISPFDPAGQRGPILETGTRNVAPQAPGQSNMASNNAGGVGAFSLQLPSDTVQSSWDPFEGTDLARKRTVQEKKDSELPVSDTSADPNNETLASDDWVVVPHPGQDTSAPAAATAATRSPHQRNASAPLNAMTGSAALAEKESKANEPRRNSSFIGLPPIKRTPTLDWTSQPTRKAAERFPLDDEEEITTSGAKEGAGEESAPDPNSGTLQQQIPSPRMNSPKLSLHTGARNPEQTPQSGLHQQQQQQQQPQQQQARQVLPPSGPWQAVESHLSQPLHAVKPNRSGSADSPQDPTFGFDKETELYKEAEITSPTTSSQAGPGQGYQPRQRFAAVPPSSARRYPELFSQAPGQGPPPNPRFMGRPPPAQYFPASEKEEMALPRTEGNEYVIPGVGPPPDDRGRKRGSGIFQGLGDRIARATSRERRNSLAGSRPQSADLRGDEVSEASILTEDRKRRRSSFLPALRGRSSTDQLSQTQSVNSMTQTPPGSATGSAPVAPSPQPTKNRFLGSIGGRMGGFSTSQLRLGSSAAPQSSTSSLANETNESVSESFNESADNSQQQQQQQPSKNRFSGIAKKVNLKGVLHRPGHDDPGAHEQTAPQGQPVHGQSPNPVSGPGSMGPPPPPGGFVSRPSSDLPPPPGAVSSEPERRGRRGSMSGMFSGLAGKLGSRSSSRTREQTEQEAFHQQQQQQLAHQYQAQQLHQLQQNQYLPQQQHPQPQQLQGPGQFQQRPPPLPQQYQHYQQYQQPLPSPSHGGGLAPPPKKHYGAAGPQPPGQEQPAVALNAQTETGRAPSMDHVQRPSIPLNPAAQQSVPAPKPSPLGLGAPMTHGSSPDDVDDAQSADSSAVVEKHTSATAHESQEPARISMQSTTDTLGRGQRGDGVDFRASTISAASSQLHGDSTEDETQEVAEGEGRESAKVTPTLAKAEPATAIRDESTHYVQKEPKQPQEPVQPTVQRPLEPTDSNPTPSPPAGPPNLPPASQQSTQAPPQQAQGPPRHIAAFRQNSDLPMESPILGSHDVVIRPQAQDAKTPSHFRPQQHFGPQGPQGPPQGYFHGQPQGRPQGPPQGSPQGQGMPQRQPMYHPGQPQGSPATSGPQQGQQWTQQYGPRPGFQTQISSQSGPQPGQLQPMQPGPSTEQTEGQGSRWKGFRNKVSGQIGGLTSQNQEATGKPDKAPKPEKSDKASGTKLLNAFKRTSKQPESLQQSGGAGSSSAASQQQWQPPPHPHHQQPQPGAPQPPPHDRRQSQPPYSQYQHERLSMATGGPPGLQQSGPHGQRPGLAVSQSQQMPPQPPQKDQRWGGGQEQQYPEVPVPRPYHASQQQQYDMWLQQQGYAQQPRHVSSPPRGMTQRQPTPATGYRRASSGATTGFQVTETQQSQQPVRDYLNPHPRNTSQPGSDHRSSPGSQVSAQAPSTSPPPTEQGAVAANGIKDSATGVEEMRAPSLSPPVAPRGPGSGGPNLSVDTAKAKEHDGEDLYDATPRLNKEATAEGSPSPAQVKSRSPEEANVAVAAAAVASRDDDRSHSQPKTGYHVELENTEDARKRTIRLNSQEEKIWYDPADDDDNPQMSATSYPGQEWNPYGMPEYADWRED